MTFSNYNFFTDVAFCSKKSPAIRYLISFQFGYNPAFNPSPIFSFADVQKSPAVSITSIKFTSHIICGSYELDEQSEFI